MRHHYETGNNVWNPNIQVRICDLRSWVENFGVSENPEDHLSSFLVRGLFMNGKETYPFEKSKRDDEFESQQFRQRLIACKVGFEREVEFECWQHSNDERYIFGRYGLRRQVTPPKPISVFGHEQSLL
jgi:hypothetical protein